MGYFSTCFIGITYLHGVAGMSILKDKSFLYFLIEMLELLNVRFIALYVLLILLQFS